MTYEIECEGCYVTDTCVVEGRDVSKCPCLRCIIKMVCNDPCEEFEVHHTYITRKYADT